MSIFLLVCGQSPKAEDDAIAKSNAFNFTTSTYYKYLDIIQKDELEDINAEDAANESTILLM